DSSYRMGGGVGIGPIGSGVDNLGHIREEDSSLYALMESAQRSQGLAGGQPPIGRAQYQESRSLEDRAGAILADRARLEMEQAEDDYARGDLEEDASLNERLQEFQQLRSTLE